MATGVWLGARGRKVERGVTPGLARAGVGWCGGLPRRWEGLSRVSQSPNPLPPTRQSWLPTVKRKPADLGRPSPDNQPRPPSTQTQTNPTPPRCGGADSGGGHARPNAGGRWPPPPGRRRGPPTAQCTPSSLPEHPWRPGDNRPGPDEPDRAHHPDAGGQGGPGVPRDATWQRKRKTYSPYGPAGGPRRKYQTQTLPPAHVICLVWQSLPHQTITGPVPTQKGAQMPRPGGGRERPAKPRRKPPP